MRGDRGRGAEPWSARAGARVEGRVLNQAARAGLLVGAALVACGGGRGASQPRPGEDCRPIAVHGRALIEREPAAAQEAATRLVAGLIDLCQEPGLAPAARSCVLAMTSIEGVRACPALTELVGDATTDGNGASCRDVVDHAMRLVEASSARPRTRTGRAEVRTAYVDGCAELTPAGRACAVAATTLAGVDDCFADPAHALTTPR